MPFNAGNISPPFQFNVQSSHVSTLENVFHFLIFAMVTMTVGTIQMKPNVLVSSKLNERICKLHASVLSNHD